MRKNIFAFFPLKTRKKIVSLQSELKTVMLTKEEALKKIESLVERFNEQKESYKKADYNETQTRRDFIDPFWKALGWDVDNENGYAESYREVIHEDRVKVGGATKAPDYSFRLPGGKRLFFLEAKKPSVEIKDDSQPAFQIRRYGWSAKLSISVITDFEEFAIYDCTTKPKPTDKASNGRIKYITYDNYIKEFDFIWDTFSKERVLKGSFDKYIQSDKNKKGTTTVDHDFLQSLDKWRIELARNIALRNKNITEEELNYVVQLTIDRIVFLRIAEDRGAEQYGTLQTAIKQGDYYQNLLHHFRIADQKYNSGLFDFERGKISTEITIDNKVIKSIVSEFYYPVCPYEFSVLSVEILGSAYEQFLGKQILLSKSGRATIEEKPEVRKAGGVYYTPQYIVEYIVKNTVGKLIENKTPKEVSDIKIVDPACGSGSFLIGAYQYLLSWHKDFYNNKEINPLAKTKHKENPLTPQGELTTAEKKRILLNNIYGADLDSNAVEVTKLSLLLKCMEGETQETIEAQRQLFHERVLPTLYNNIKSGNSLIDLDYYDNKLDFGEERKIKPFSWAKSFPEVFKQGGFDCVIGNPPYVLGRETFDETIKKYIAQKYFSYGGKYDLYIFFCEKALKLLKQSGIFSFIIPNAILTNENATKIRELILKDYTLQTIRTYKNKVFDNAQVETVVIAVENTKSQKENIVKIVEDDKTIEIPIERFLKNVNFKFNVAVDDKSENLIDKISSCSILLGQLTETCIGIQLGGSHGNSTKENFLSKQAEDETWKKVLDGKDINTYKLNWRNVFVHYGNWLHRKRNEKYFLNPKILIRQIGKTPIATYDEIGFYSLNTLYNVISAGNYSLKYILAIINSNLGKWFWIKMNSDFKTLFPKIKKSEIEAIPICEIDFENKKQKQSYDEIVKIVDLLLQLNKELQVATLPEKTEQIQSRIGYCEDKINEIVYRLYGLTEEEVKVIEQ